MVDSELAFDLAWLPATADDPRSSATFAALTITAGRDQIPVTEVDDSIAQTVRRDIRVPMLPLAQWLVVNWWRLRWEPRTETSRTSRTHSWLRAHSMSSVSTDVPWPALSFTSDSAFIQLKARAERIPDVAAVRYLRDIELSVPADHFERAVDGVLAKIDARIAACVPGDRDFADLLAELREERSDPKLARACKLQALAGFDPGMAPPEWLRDAGSLAEDAGQSTGDEVVAAIPTLQDGIIGARKAIEAMKHSHIDIRLASDTKLADGPVAELPWQRGRRLATWFRSGHDLGDGPVPTCVLEQLLDVRLPMPVTPGAAGRVLMGGYRNGVSKGRTRVVVTTDRIDNQRFYLGRLLGASLVAAPHDHVLPVTGAATAFQKFERSFAQELLCPWEALDKYTDEHGTDDDGIAAAAAHFNVSELLVVSTLVNNGKLEHSAMHEPWLSSR
jgi:hypothetical protein